MRKKEGEIVSVTKDGVEKFVLVERVKRNKLPSGDVELVMVGYRYDVTDVFTRHTIGQNTYVRRMENALVKLARENFALRGITVTDEELKDFFFKVADEERKEEQLG